VVVGKESMGHRRKRSRWKRSGSEVEVKDIQLSVTTHVPTQVRGSFMYALWSVRRCGLL
jgi:hypothetical protein